MDWLIGFRQSAIFGGLSGTAAWLWNLPAILSGLIAFTCCYLLWVGIQVKKSLPSLVEPHTIDSIQTNAPEFISMQEAATRLYESQATVAGVKLSVAAERLGNLTLGAASPNERLEYLAHFISRKIDIYGRKSPSRIVEKIDENEVRRASFSDGASVLRDNIYDKSIFWIDLCVRSAQLNNLIRALVTDDEEGAFKRGFGRATYQKAPNRENALSRLAQLRSEGVVIRNESSELLFTADLDTWGSKVEAWMNEVVESLKPVSEEDSEWFTTLDTVPPPRVSIPNIRLGGDFDRQIFIKAFREHDYRLVRLEKLLVKYGVGA